MYPCTLDRDWRNGASIFLALRVRVRKHTITTSKYQLHKPHEDSLVYALDLLSLRIR